MTTLLEEIRLRSRIESLQINLSLGAARKRRSRAKRKVVRRG